MCVQYEYFKYSIEYHEYNTPENKQFIAWMVRLKKNNFFKYENKKLFNNMLIETYSNNSKNLK